MRLSRDTEPDLISAGALPSLKRHLRITGDYADQDVHEIAKMALRHIEEKARITTLTSTYTLQLDVLPECFNLPYPPLVSVTSIQYQDADNVQQTWNSNQYEVLTKDQPGKVRALYGVTMPDMYPSPGVEVVYTAGYGTGWDDLPDLVKHATKLVTHHHFYNRDGSPPMAAIEDIVMQLNAGDEFG